MSQDKRYTRAPLTEALIDLRVVPSENIGLETLAKVQFGLEDVYPVKRDRVEFVGKFTMTGGDAATARHEGDHQQTGYTFVSKDEKQYVQAYVGGFTFNRLAPYDSWENFRNEARQLWDIYRSIVQPKGVHRLAVRYINRLDLPLPMRDLRDYLRTSPEVSSDLPQQLFGYLMQLQIPYEDLKATLILNENLIPSSTKGVASVILDIDLFAIREPTSDEEVIWDLFEKLRIRKNEVFESCITNNTRRLIS